MAKSFRIAIATPRALDMAKRVARVGEAKNPGAGSQASQGAKSCHPSPRQSLLGVSGPYSSQSTLKP